MNAKKPRKHDFANTNRECALSVVIIGRNEKKNIARCIESATAAANALPYPYEIIYVDSASTDESVAIACRYPVTVICIAPGEWRCAAAGRFIGTKYSKGEYVAFLDGDMACDPEWFVRGMQQLREGKGKIGAVTGSKDYRCAVTEQSLRVSQNYSSVTQINRFGGAAIISSDALSASGGFAPYLISNEEADLSDRILAAGFKIIGLPYKMITHYGPPPNIVETLRRGNYGYHTGLGQYIHRLWLRKKRWKAFLTIKVQIAFTAWVISCVTLLLVGILTGSQLIVAFCLSTVPASCLVFIMRTGSLHKGMNMFYSQFLVIPGILRGVLKKTPICQYQPNIAVVRESDIQAIDRWLD